MRILGSPSAWAAIIGFAVAPLALGAQPSVFPETQADRIAPAVPAGDEKIVNTFIHNSGSYSGIVEAAGTLVQIDSQNVLCTKLDKSCTIVVGANVQASGSANAGNVWAIVIVVDGSYVDEGPYQGELLPDGGYGYGYMLQSTSVAPGEHTIAVQVYSYDGLTTGYYQIQYSLYEP